MGRKALLLIFVRRSDSDEQLVPFLVFARFGGTASRKRPVQQLEIRDQILLCPSPIRQFLTARSGHLVPKELDYAFVNPIIVRLHNTLAVLVVEPEQAFLFNGRPDNWIDVRIDFRRQGSSPTLPLTTFMQYSDILLRGCAVPMCAARNIFGRFRRWPKTSADFALVEA